MGDERLYIGRKFGEILRALRRSRRLNQHDLATYIDRDNTYISKLESGHLHCTPLELAQLADALTNDLDTRNSLYIAYERATGRAVVGRDADRQVQDLNTLIKSTQRLRLLGEPQLAFELSSSQLDTVLEHVRGAKAPVRQGHPMLGMACELVLERTKAALDFMPSEQVKRGDLSRSLEIQAEIATIASDPIAATATQLSHEAAAYCSGDYKKAHRIGIDLLDNIPDYNGSWTAEVIRSVAINSGLVGDESALEGANRSLVANRSLMSDDEVGFVLEGLARGNTQSDPIQAREMITEARDIYQRMPNVAPIRLVQLARAQGLADISTNMHRLADHTRNEVEHALTVSREKRYVKYEAQLENLLRRTGSL